MSYSSPPATSWLTFPEAESERERAQVARAAFRLLHLANIVSVTSHG